MKIGNSTAVWILAKLYRDDGFVARRSLVRELCQASFDLMDDENEFANVIAKLDDNGYIIRQRNTTNYQITEKGMIVFRQEIGSPLKKAENNLNFTASQNAKYESIIRVLKEGGDITLNAAILCIDNTPLLLEFLAFIATLF